MRIENRLAYSKPILLLALLLFSQVQVQSWSNAARISPVGSRGSTGTSTSAMLRFATFRIAGPAAAPGQRIIAASLRCAVRQASMSVSSSVTPSEESQTRNSDPSAAAVVVGGGRGIGLAMAKNLCSRFAGRIYVTARNPQKSPGLQELIDAQDLQPVGQGSHDAPTHQQSLTRASLNSDCSCSCSCDWCRAASGRFTPWRWTLRRRAAWRFVPDSPVLILQALLAAPPRLSRLCHKTLCREVTHHILDPESLNSAREPQIILGIVYCADGATERD